MFAAGYIWNYVFFRVKNSSDDRRDSPKVLAELSDEEMRRLGDSVKFIELIELKTKEE